MSKRELTPTDSKMYAQRITEEFDLEVKEVIDFPSIDLLESEIERRRKIFSYFIPDVFITTRYNRRADIIDGSIYYLAYLDSKGEHQIVLDYWSKRAGFNKRFDPSDVECDVYGYEIYHPLWYVLGDINNPQKCLPRIVRYIQAFRGRKRRLDLNDYSLIFFSIFNVVPAMEITAKMLQFLHLLHRKIEETPLLDSINLKEFMRENRFKNVRSFQAEFNRMGVRIHPVYERAAFGLGLFTIYCPFPHHYEIHSVKNSHAQHFLTNGENYIQELIFNIPLDVNWRLLARKFHPKTEFYRLTRFPLHNQGFLKYFNYTMQDWDVPWDKTVKEWKECIENVKELNAPIEPQYEYMEPTKEILTVCSLLELEGNMRNKDIHDKTKIPVDMIRKIREKLEKTLVFRALYLFHSNINEYFLLRFPRGNELWKYRILKKLGEIFPYFFIYYGEDLRESKKYLIGSYVHSPKLGIMFMKYFPTVFDDVLEYKLLKRLARPRLFSQSILEWFDPETNSWIWNPDDYRIRSLSFKIQ